MDSKIPAVTMRDISKSFGTVLANDKVWLDIYRGEILAQQGQREADRADLGNRTSFFKRGRGRRMYKAAEGAAVCGQP